jgi:hypothetical protein
MLPCVNYAFTKLCDVFGFKWKGTNSIQVGLLDHRHEVIVELNKFFFSFQ